MQKAEIITLGANTFKGDLRYYSMISSSSRSHVVVTLNVETKVDLTLEESNSTLVASVRSSVKRGKKNAADPNTTPPTSTCKQQLRLQIVDLAGASAPTFTQDSMDTFIKRSLPTLGKAFV